MLAKFLSGPPRLASQDFTGRQKNSELGRGRQSENPDLHIEATKNKILFEGEADTIPFSHLVRLLSYYKNLLSR